LRFQREARLVGRLVPGRDHAARVRVLELGVEGALLLAIFAGIVEREQAHGLGADHAAVVERQAVEAGRERLVEGEGRGLGGGVDAHLRGLRGAAGAGVALTLAKLRSAAFRVMLSVALLTLTVMWPGREAPLAASGVSAMS
jgi:hypothetical protein